jgi:predicted ATP-grasp superfamily ATP-dependent carboligase
LKGAALNSKPHAIIIGLDCITGLQSARILARHGIPVIGLAKDLDHYCCQTRVCEQILPVDGKSEALITTLEEIGSRLEQKAVLVPCTDMSVLLISRHRSRLESLFHFALPEESVVETLLDKVAFYTYAAQAGLPIPKTFFLHNRADALRASGELSYPCILKPPMKNPEWEKNTNKKVFKLESQEDFLACYDQCSKWADVLMVQDWVEGPDANLYSCNCYFDRDSQPQVTFIARKIRQWPPEIGTSCLGEEVRNDVVLQASLALFAGLRYHGLGYVEMKKDSRTGVQYIIEPNIGRPTGRSAIAEFSGVELLYTMYCDLVGLPLPKNREQKYQGTKWVYLRRDLQSAFHYWRKGKISLRDWGKSLWGIKQDAVFSWSDPLPFLADYGQSALTVFTRRKRNPRVENVKRDQPATG